MSAPYQAEYQLLVNWDQPDEQSIGIFETDLDSWVAASGVQLNRSNERAHRGAYSLELLSATTNGIIFGGSTGFDTFTFGSSNGPVVGLSAYRTITGLTVGVTYAVYCWVYVPAGGYHLKLTTDDFITETTSTHVNDWVYLETTFEADASSQIIELHTVTTPGADGTMGVFMDDAAYKVAGEDITCMVFGNRGSINTNEGRDLARALSPTGTAESAFEFENVERLYSPNNPDGRLFNKTSTNIPVQIRAIFEGRIYILYNGYIDEYTLQNELPNFSTIKVGTIDVLGQLAATNISTGLYQNIRTGEAIGYILDEIGWPEGKRKLNYGSTVLDWWWVDDQNALQAVNDLVGAEGLPSIVFTDDVGDFVFKDRHHRYVDPNSLVRAASYGCSDGLASEDA